MSLSPPTLLELDSPATSARTAGFFLCADAGTIGGSFISYQTRRDDAPKDKKLVIDPCDKINIARIIMERIDGVVAQARVSTPATIVQNLPLK